MDPISTSPSPNPYQQAELPQEPPIGNEVFKQLEFSLAMNMAHQMGLTGHKFFARTKEFLDDLDRD